jgi:hypothetical protein
MAAGANDKFLKVGVAGTLTSLSAPGHSVSGTTITVGSTTNWPTDTATVFAIRQVDSSGSLVAGTYTEWRGIVSGSTLTNMTLMYGTDQVYPAGSTTQVYIPLSAAAHNRLIDGILSEHDQDGTHGAITASSITATTGTFDSVVVSGTATSQGWTPLGDVPDTVTANGNRNYDIVFNGVDHTSTLSPGMKLQLTRTVAAPDQCTDLESGSSQYFNKTSPAGMTFTDDFVVSAWVKLESYTGAEQAIASRYNGTSGWRLMVNGNGQLFLAGHNAGASNVSYVQSYASLPLNKWVHVAAQLDMSTFTATTTTSYIMFDGVDVAVQVLRTGTNPTALVQAGDLQIGKGSTTDYFDGKIAQVAIYSAKVTQATIKASMNQALSGSETSLISAYSFNGVLTDLNANANNLTANGGAAATATDSPFANAVAAGTLEYAEINSVTFSTNTTVNVRVPDTCQIPTSGGVSAVSYSTQSNPYGLPYFSRVLAQAILQSNATTTSTTSSPYAAIPGLSLTAYIPTGAKVKVSWSAQVVQTLAGNTVVMASYNGTTSGTPLSAASWTPYSNNVQGSLERAIENTPTSGSNTYTMGWYVTPGGTGTIAAAAGTPAKFTVELV